MSVDLRALAAQGMQSQPYVSQEALKEAREAQQTAFNVNVCLAVLQSGPILQEAQEGNERGNNANSVRLQAGKLLLNYLNGLTEGK